MKTVVIKMDDLTPDAAGAKVYPVQLFFDDGGANWLKQPIATTSIPEDLSIPDPPEDPVTKNPIDGREIRDAFINESGDSTRFSKWGIYLHKLLFHGDIATEWKRLRGLYPGEVKDKSEGLRTILDIKPDALRWLPWELIQNEPPPWFFDPTNPFSRGTLEKSLEKDPEKEPKDKTFYWPIHALVVVGSKKGDEKVNAEKELENIQKAFIKSPVPIDWYVCCRPTKAKLTDLIAKYKPQIFHFIGHGKESDDYSFLELTDDKGGPTAEEWTVDDIMIGLKPWQPRFAFINACRTSSAAAQENSWDIARAFSESGVPAVVGMQADIKNEAAPEFSEILYSSMLHGLPLDSALAAARAAVKDLKGITIRRRDWALATLYLQQLPDQILKMTPPIDKDTTEKFRADGRLKKTNDFVGRLKQRRRLWHGVDQVEDRDDDFNSAFIVVGNAQMGKTSLVQASLRVCALRHRQISYVDIGYDSTKDFLDILEAIRKGDPKSSEIICAPLPAKPFAYFDEKYSDRLAMPDIRTQLAADSNLCEQFFNAYKEALITIAAEEQFILVLDHLNVEWETFNSVLVKHLLLPIAKDQLPNCRLVVACSAEDFDKRLSKDLIEAAQVVSVAAWKPEKYVPLMRQICLYNDIELDEDVEGTILAMSKLVNSEWGPAELRELLAPIKRARGVKK